MSTPNAPGRPGNSLHFAVGEISGKLDQLIATMLPELVSLKAAHGDLDSRVTSLEVWQGRIGGGFVVITFIITSWEVFRYVILK